MKILITALKAFGVIMGLFTLLGGFLWLSVWLTLLLVPLIPIDRQLVFIVIVILLISIIGSIFYTLEVEDL